MPRLPLLARRRISAERRPGAPSAREPMRALGEAAGLKLENFRGGHVEQCVRRALIRERVPDAVALAHRLDEDPGARRRLRRSVAVSVTAMLREREPLERSLGQVLREGHPLRVWSAGCANGAELHGVAALLAGRGLLDRAQLLGSDLLVENVEAARARPPDLGAVSATVLGRACWEVRDLVADDPAAGTFDLVLCRNVAIYLSAPAKAVLHRNLVAALARDGLLVLGRSELLLEPGSLGLAPVAPHVYRRVA